MKAAEVLRRYAAGERNFRKANLRGQSFWGQDLSGADFSGADIRSTDFSNAILKGTNFTQVVAGVQRRWWLVQQAIGLVMGFISGVLSSSSGVLLVSLLSQSANSNAYFLGGIVAVGLVLTSWITTVRQGFTFSAAIKIITSVAVIIIISIVVTFVSVFSAAFASVGPVAVKFASTATISVAFAVVGIGFIVGTSSVAITNAGAIAGAGVITIGNTGFGGFGAFTCVTVSILLGFYCKNLAFKGDKKFTLIHTIAVALGAIGGTSFKATDLTRANFSQAVLRRANFNPTHQKPTVLTQIYWDNCKQLDRARLGNSMLANPAVRELLVTRNGYQKSYVNANLQGANLNGVNLEQADLRQADLSEATLRDANLKEANLTDVLATGADFTNACLTGACLEDWNINADTHLDQVDCQFVYLKNNQQERRPSSGDFAPGQFTKLFEEVLNTIDLIFQDGVDWKAFIRAFKQVQVQNGDTPLEIQSIENKGDGVIIVRVNVPPHTDKAKIHSEFNQNYELAIKELEARYQAQLQAQEEQISKFWEQNANMLGIIDSLANRPINITNTAISESKAMSDSTDRSQTVNIHGNVTGSTINLGEISGSVSNVINQLPSAPDPTQPGIKELLAELKAAIESDTELPDKGKATALEQVKVLAEVAQGQDAPEKKSLGSQAVNLLKGAASFLPDTAKLAEACSKLLPLITKALGLPF